MALSALFWHRNPDKMGEFLSPSAWAVALYEDDESIDGRVEEVGDVFLCDWRNDPQERRNLASDPRFGDVRDRLTQLADQHVANARDSRAPPYPWRGNRR